jgi:hypothetical protein
MISTHSRASSPQWAMIEDSAEEFLVPSSGARAFGFPSPRRRGIGASHAAVMTTRWMENAPATQATMMVPPRKAVPQSDTDLPFVRHRTCHWGQ